MAIGRIYPKGQLWIALSCLFICTISLHSQNLIPNGSFEKVTDFDYMDPCSAFPNLEHWYRANYFTVDSTRQGTPDLFDVNHPYPSSPTPNFWNISYGATDGDYHIGIADHLTYEGFHAPEAIATELFQPLEAGEYYYLEFHYRNKGIAGYLDNLPILCVPEENKRIEAHFSTDSIFITIDEHINNSFSNASKVISLTSKKIRTHHAGIWEKAGTCFQASGGERFIAVTLPTGKFSVLPPHTIYDEHWNVFYVFYFDIDNISLSKLTDGITLNQEICENRGTKINIADIAPLPIMQNPIEYHWEDGTVDSVNYISQIGTYLIDAHVDCKTIPITLNVSGAECEPSIYIPNAFSPNGDGKNDYLQAYIDSELDLEDFQFHLYNKWGGLMFSTDQPDFNWDGNYQQAPLNNGFFTWILQYAVDDIELGIQYYQQTGNLSIIR